MTDYASIRVPARLRREMRIEANNKHITLTEYVGKVIETVPPATRSTPGPFENWSWLRIRSDDAVAIRTAAVQLDVWQHDVLRAAFDAYRGE